MKKSAIVLSVILVLLILGSWAAHFGALASSSRQYDALMGQAEAYTEKGLFQKAMQSLEQALAIDENKEGRDAWVEAGKAAYADGVLSAKELGNVVQTACDLYPQAVEYWETLLSHYLSVNNYTASYEALLDSQKAEASSALLKELGNQVRYAFNLSRKTFTGYTRSPSGYYSVTDGEGWGMVDPAGERAIDCDYLYISPYDKDGTAVYISDKGVRLIDTEGIVESILIQDVTQARAYSQGLLPVCDAQGKWNYIDCATGQVALGGYEDASSFTDGVAAVCSGGSWSLVDTQGQPIGTGTFDDIKLHSNGDYAYDGIMVASQGGKYGIYDAKGTSLAAVNAQDMDAYYGGDMAFLDASGKWGYVNKKGEQTVAPAFEQAKSFSGGLAAVMTDGLWGYVDASGTVVIQCQFLAADYFTKEGATLISDQEGLYIVLKRRFQ